MRLVIWIVRKDLTVDFNDTVRKKIALAYDKELTSNITVKSQNIYDGIWSLRTEQNGHHFAVATFNLIYLGFR